MIDFDTIIDRRSSNSIKWKLYGEDVLPLWVADMDFAAPQAVQEVLQRAIEHGILGYDFPTKALREVVAARMDRLYGWQVSPEAVVATPGIVAGFVAAANAVCKAGEGVLVQPPVYPPFLNVHEKAGLKRQLAPLHQTVHGAALEYEVDWDVFESALNSDDTHTGMFLLCNPHNPTGQVYTRAELTHMAKLCLKNDTIICSDEIHSELLLGSSTSAQGHIPIASLDPEIAARTITLIAPSKTFNIPGLFCGFAIIPNPEMCEQYKKTVERLAMHVNGLGLLAAQEAFSGACDDWLSELRLYLTANRDHLVDYVQREFSGIKMTNPQATYLAWLDCNEWVKSGRITGTPHEFFRKQAKVALNEGAEFGSQGAGFVRLNFGCPRATLDEALLKMKSALDM